MTDAEMEKREATCRNACGSIRKLYAQYAKCPSAEYDAKEPAWGRFYALLLHLENKGIDTSKGTISEWSKTLGIPKQSIHQFVMRHVTQGSLRSKPIRNWNAIKCDLGNLQYDIQQSGFEGMAKDLQDLIDEIQVKIEKMCEAMPLDVQTANGNLFY